MTTPARLRLCCRGVVQGVGFRPFLHRLATELDLRGTVRNVVGAVEVDLAGDRFALETLLWRLPRELPKPALLEPLLPRWLPPMASTVPWDSIQPIESIESIEPTGVRILASEPVPLGIGLVAPSLAPDLAPCPSCLAELADCSDRRFGYPFISCCACGPRYSIATAEPFSRLHTSLAAFSLCGSCEREFHDPANRRFHAETIGCPACGPQLALWDPTGAPMIMAGPNDTDPKSKINTTSVIRAARDLLLAGRILALQGVGGFQLLVDATNAAAVASLRQRKQRPAKPFALLVADANWVACHCQLDAAERALLKDAAAPIVLLRRRHGKPEAFPGVAPGSPCLGVMLPASPLHHLLSRACGRPLVATSGNRSGEPLCTDPHEALRRLAHLADGFLVHNRPIARPLDDSVLQVIGGRPALLRRARGYAPQGVKLPQAGSQPAGVVALGGDLKSAPALALERSVWLAAHLGDLADPRLQERLRQGIEEMGCRYGHQLGAIVADAHPGYISHQLADTQPWPRQVVQHHLAHGLALLAEHGLQPPLLVIACDGLGFASPQRNETGVSEPAELWGGELLLITPNQQRQEGGIGFAAERLAALRPFPLPGAERAMGEPRRAALGVLVAAGPRAQTHPGAHHTRAAFSGAERDLLEQAITSGCNSPVSSSVGRLFDAVASLLGLCQTTSYEGEGGLRLQGAAAQASGDGDGYPLPLLATNGAAGNGQGQRSPSLGWLDWQPLLEALLADVAANRPASHGAARFHRGLALGWADLAVLAARQVGCRRVALVGGCFQNHLLLEQLIADLRQRGLEPYWSEAVPCNDGGLALGQAWAVLGGAPAVQPSAQPLNNSGVVRRHQPG